MDAILVTGSGDRGSASTHDIVVITQDAGRIRARAAPGPRSRASNRVVGSLATPTGSNFVRLLENVDFPPRRSAGRSRRSLTESALRAVGADPELGRRSPELRRPAGCARRRSVPAPIRSSRPRAIAATRSRSTWRAQSLPARDPGSTAAVRVHRARFLERCGARHWRQPGRHIHQHEHVTPRHIRAHDGHSGDRAADTSIGSDVSSDCDSAKLEGGEEIKTKST